MNAGLHKERIKEQSDEKNDNKDMLTREERPDGDGDSQHPL